MNIWDDYKIGDLPEEVRADVTKTLIQEVEATKRKEIEETEATKRKTVEEKAATIKSRENNENYHLVRGAGMIVLALLVLSACCVSYNAVDSWKAIKLGHEAPASSAAAAPSK